MLAFGCKTNVVFEHDKKIVSDTLYQIPGIGLNMCAAECMANTECLSVNYNTKYFICYLNKEDSSIENAKHYSSVTKSQLQIVCKDCLKSCDLSCPPRNKCIKSTSGVSTCIPLDCGPLPLLDKGKKDKGQDSTMIGSEVTFSCDKGYAPDGPLTITCSANGHWTLIGRCLRCGHIPELQNAETKDKNRAYNAVVTYTCIECYENVGDISITCLANETWSPIMGFCREEEHRKGEDIQFCWRVFTSTKTYDDAMAACEKHSLNGRLLMINSNQKRNRVSSALMERFGTPNKTLNFWVNGRYTAYGNYHIFSNGGLYRYHLMDEQPDRSGNCLAVSSAGAYKWNDLHCKKEFPFICEAAIY
ncbi:sushi, von Willebrand factor type A, EGF and pentraxin domain-containing protein 1-like [Saccostrea echinata]|uniref:sushi, von Willebrand factor type A, EGF and pentraxin domain-containing protein 1-like n=1 Tax=Saccostrea echinata TaxID=191078 RepID=UPI002A83CB48|nr:sushi, von Willebrand factor type A, EGF and pentraxin domain-containing protein 1-like [Saccostrea echinata]